MYLCPYFVVYLKQCIVGVSETCRLLLKVYMFVFVLFTYLSILVDGFRVQSRGDHGWPPLACGILSNSSDIEGCRAVVSGVIWIRLLDSARLM